MATRTLNSLESRAMGSVAMMGWNVEDNASILFIPECSYCSLSVNNNDCNSWIKAINEAIVSNINCVNNDVYRGSFKRGRPSIWIKTVRLRLLLVDRTDRVLWLATVSARAQEWNVHITAICHSRKIFIGLKLILSSTKSARAMVCAKGWLPPPKRKMSHRNEKYKEQER